MKMQDNVFLAVAVGGLIVLRKEEPKPYTRRARMCRQLSNLILDEGATIVPLLEEDEMEKAKQAISASEDVFRRVAEEQDISQADIALNLVLFCMEELKLSPKCYRRVNALFSCYSLSDRYEAVRAGQRVWQCLETEMEILQCNK